MPQFDWARFLPEVLWTAISFALLFMVIKRWILPRIAEGLNARTAAIETDIAEAKKVREEAERLRSDYQAQLRQADQEIRKMMKDAEQHMDERRETLMHELHEEITRRKRRFHEDLEGSKALALKQMRRETAELVVEATEKAMHKHLDEATATALVEEALHDVESQLGKHRSSH